MSNDSNTTQRDELAREIWLSDRIQAAAPGGAPSEFDHAVADRLIAKYILIPRPKVGEAQRGNSQVILIDGVGITCDAAWLRSELAAEDLALESSAYRVERIRSALAYLDTEERLQERRDAVKAELVKALLNSTGPTDFTWAAIDRIIELEDAAEATK